MRFHVSYDVTVQARLGHGAKSQTYLFNIGRKNTCLCQFFVKSRKINPKKSFSERKSEKKWKIYKKCQKIKRSCDIKSHTSLIFKVIDFKFWIYVFDTELHYLYSGFTNNLKTKLEKNTNFKILNFKIYYLKKNGEIRDSSFIARLILIRLM